jgi:hypothetical protein
MLGMTCHSERSEAKNLLFGCGRGPRYVSVLKKVLPNERLTQARFEPLRHTPVIKSHAFSQLLLRCQGGVWDKGTQQVSIRTCLRLFIADQELHAAVLLCQRYNPYQGFVLPGLLWVVMKLKDLQKRQREAPQNPKPAPQLTMVDSGKRFSWFNRVPRTPCSRSPLRRCGQQGQCSEVMKQASEVGEFYLRVARTPGQAFAYCRYQEPSFPKTILFAWTHEVPYRFHEGAGEDQNSQMIGSEHEHCLLQAGNRVG